jgi:hypothetical protein
MGWTCWSKNCRKIGGAYLFRKITLLFNTIRYLKISQVIWRIFYKFYSPQINLGSSLLSNQCSLPWVQYVQYETSLIELNRSRFLNLEADISSHTIWNDSNFSKLWLYNLHYFDCLNASNANLRLHSHLHLLNRWVDENPPFIGNGWEPYTISRRTVNWIKWALTYNKLSQILQHSLQVQVRFLRKRLEWHILGNHILANAKALIFAGLFFKGSEAKEWYDKGVRILEDQLSEQVLNDGGHFELSPMYQLIVLEDLIDIIQIHKCFSLKPPDLILLKIKKMFNWANIMKHPDGNIPFFNDASFGVAPTIKDLNTYLTKLDLLLDEFKCENDLCHLKSSGYIRLTKNRMCAFLDVASVGPKYQPGHAHADTLSFELSIDKNRVLVNKGTSVYGNGIDRHLERKTISHNTVVIDNTDSTEVWSGFRVGKRANSKILKTNVGNDEILVEAQHDGYISRNGKPIHRRSWLMSNQKLVINDYIDGTGFHSIDCIFNFSPDFIPIAKNENLIEVYNSRSQKLICNFKIENMHEIILEPTKWSPYFGINLDAWRVRARFIGYLPHQSINTLSLM